MSESPMEITTPSDAAHGFRRYVNPSTGEQWTAPHAACAWHGPEGQTCTEPWTTERTGDKLCRKHAALAELAQEPLRPPEKIRP